MLKKIVLYSGFVILFLWWIYRKMYHPDETGIYKVKTEEIISYDTIVGPAEGTALPAESFTAWKKFAKGGTSSIAILVTDTNSSWLALAHGLKSIGVPFLITQNYKAALRHQIVMVYPELSGKYLRQDALKLIAQHPLNGGVLMATGTPSDGLKEVFGYTESKASIQRYEIRFNRKAKENEYLKAESGWMIRLGNKERGVDPIATNTYYNVKNEPIAYYEDNTPAVIVKPYAIGRSYLIGFDLGYFLQRSYSNTRYTISPLGEGKFEPSSDVLLSLIKNIYLTQCTTAVVLGTVPHNKQMSLILTHNINTKQELLHAVKVAAQERRGGFTSSFFVQAKYINDYNGEAYLRPYLTDILKLLVGWNMEVGTQGVSANNRFANNSVGKGIEKYPDYTPFVQSEKKTYNATLMGETRVAKYLLEKLLGNYEMKSFRAPDHQIPRSMPQLLQANSFSYSSSITSDKVLSHLPYRLNYNYDISQEVETFEFPVTVDDDQGIKSLQSSISATIDMAYSIANYGGMMVLSLRPDTSVKMQFQQQLVDAVKEFAWIGSLGNFADWWSARDKVEFSRTMDTIEVNIPVRAKGITLQLPPGERMYNYEPADLPIDQYGNSLLIYDYVGKAKIYITRNNK